ncbi:unnamed protein product [Rotaria sp. Silwood2]|nr:unnamed protein product [Rotaria sp. Silwood2]CAF4221768.1 unnamed protein product [Rotaria sp. Silwood2]
MSDKKKKTQKRQATRSSSRINAKKRRIEEELLSSKQEDKPISSTIDQSSKANSKNNDQNKTYVDLWQTLNDKLSLFPRYQNKNPGASDVDIKHFEQHHRIQLPDDVKQAIHIHDGRDKIDYGLCLRLASTDLLPLSQWLPFEECDWASELFEELSNDGSCAVKSLQDDAQSHLVAYRKNSDLKKNKAFHKLSPELIVIGQGMDDYCEVKIS